MAHYVAVVGPSDATADEQALSYDVGRRLADVACIVVTGGLGGVMASAAAGAASVGGTSVGLLPGADRAEASDGLTIVLPTGLGEMRNGLVVRAVDAVIAVGGSWGTLSEIALAMRTGTPLVSVGGWRIRTSGGDPIEVTRADDAAAAVEYVLHMLNQA